MLKTIYCFISAAVVLSLEQFAGGAANAHTCDADGRPGSGDFKTPGPPWLIIPMRPVTSN
jgi:hypothetical protein